MTFDPTINISDLILFAGGILAFVRVWLTVRDGMRALTEAVGEKGPPPTGLMGDVHHLRRETRTHRDWLIRAGLDGRPDDRGPE
jgi:hypothetical protein